MKKESFTKYMAEKHPLFKAEYVGELYDLLTTFRNETIDECIEALPKKLPMKFEIPKDYQFDDKFEKLADTAAIGFNACRVQTKEALEQLK